MASSFNWSIHSLRRPREELLRFFFGYKKPLEECGKGWQLEGSKEERSELGEIVSRMFSFRREGDISFRRLEGLCGGGKRRGDKV